MVYSYDRRASAPDEETLRRTLANLPKIRVLEEEGVKLGEELKKVLLQVREIRQKYKSYRRKGPFELVGDDELAEKVGFTYETGDDAIELSTLASNVHQLLKMKGASDRLEERIKKYLGKQ